MNQYPSHIKECAKKKRIDSKYKRAHAVGKLPASQGKCRLRESYHTQKLRKLGGKLLKCSNNEMEKGVLG